MGDDLWTVGFHAVLGILESEQPVDVLWIQKDRRDRRMQQVRAAARSRGIHYDLAAKKCPDAEDHVAQGDACGPCEDGP